MKKNDEARLQAIADMREELKKEKKVLLHFRVELNAPIKRIVTFYLKEQKKVHNEEH